MRILVIEDDLMFRSTLVEALQAAAIGVEAVVASSRDSAYAQLSAGGFDLVVCDLKIPSQDNSLDADEQHGLAVLGKCKQEIPGTPLFVLSAFGTGDLVRDFLLNNPSEDLFGTGAKQSLWDFVSKENFEKLITAVARHANEFEYLSNIEFVVGSDPSDGTVKRIVRILARRHNGRQIRMHRLGGGLSTAAVVRVEVLDGEGVQTLYAVGKIDRIEALDDAKARYGKHIAPLLVTGSFAHECGEVRAGAASMGALFYGLVSGWDDLYHALQSDPSDAASRVPTIQRLEQPWLASAQNRTFSVAEVRRRIVADSVMEEKKAVLASLGWQRFEEKQFVAKRCCQHGDLHGGNAMVEHGGPRVVLIDYGNVDIFTAAHDPVTLELSLLFHPEGVRIAGGWPSDEQAKLWFDLDRYVDGCPFPQFVRECRRWALEVAAGKKEICACAYSYAVRQLRYDNANNGLVLAVAGAAIKGFDSE